MGLVSSLQYSPSTQLPHAVDNNLRLHPRHKLGLRKSTDKTLPAASPFSTSLVYPGQTKSVTITIVPPPSPSPFRKLPLRIPPIQTRLTRKQSANGMTSTLVVRRGLIPPKPPPRQPRRFSKPSKLKCIKRPQTPPLFTSLTRVFTVKFVHIPRFLASGCQCS